VSVGCSYVRQAAVGSGRGRFVSGIGGEVVIDLSGDVALEAADDLAFGQAFGCTTCDIVACGLVVANPNDGDGVEGAVCCAVAAGAKPLCRSVVRPLLAGWRATPQSFTDAASLRTQSELSPTVTRNVLRSRRRHRAGSEVLWLLG